MKRIAITMILILMSITLISCKNKDEEDVVLYRDELVNFTKKFNQKYPHGLINEDGWYKIISYYISIEENGNYILKNREIIAYLDFKDNYEGVLKSFYCINSYSLFETETSLEPKEYLEYQEWYLQGKYLKQLQKKQNEVITNKTIGSNVVDDSTSFIFNFDFEDEYNYSSMLYDIKQEIISKDNKPYREIVYYDKVLSTTKFYPTDNHENGKTVTNQYFFDKEVNLVKNIKLEEMYYENDGQIVKNISYNSIEKVTNLLEIPYQIPSDSHEEYSFDFHEFIYILF